MNFAVAFLRRVALFEYSLCLLPFRFVPFHPVAGMNMKSGLESELSFRVVAIVTVCVCSTVFCALTTIFYRHGILVS